MRKVHDSMSDLLDNRVFTEAGVCFSSSYDYIHDIIQETLSRYWGNYTIENSLRDEFDDD